MNEIGIGWRHPHYGELLATRPALDFIEVHSENFFGAGGAARRREGVAHAQALTTKPKLCIFFL